MPFYDFIHTKTGKIESIFFHMEDKKVYNGPNGKQIGQWTRLWTKPNAAIDTLVDPHSSKDFVKATNKRGSVGDLWDRSRELSHKRQEKEGKDFVRESFYKRYSKKHHGALHPEQRREKIVRDCANSGLIVELPE